MPAPLTFVQRLTYKGNRYKPVISSAALAKNPKTPGFFFWSVVVNPKEDSIVIWDSGTGNVQCRFMNNLEVNWEILHIHQADCISVAADKGHVYMTDYDKGPAHTRLWMQAVTGGALTDATKYFIVADSVSGKILANVTVGAGHGISPSLIVPGRKNDVFVGTAKALTRVFIE